MYLVMLCVGAGFIVISLVAGELFEIEGTGFFFVRPILIAAFLAIFGATGLVIGQAFGPTITFAISISVAFIIAFLINRLVIVPLYKLQNTSVHDKQSLIGIGAKVSSPIPQGGYGKIRYSVNGSIVTSPAKCEDGGEIKVDESVTIRYIEKNTYFVKREDRVEFGFDGTKL